MAEKPASPRKTNPPPASGSRDFADSAAAATPAAPPVGGAPGAPIPAAPAEEVPAQPALISPVDFRAPATDEELLEQCEVQVFRAGGKGGQNVNRRETAVRLIHRPTGVVVTCQDERSQLQNKMRAVANLRVRLAQLAYRPPKRRPTRVPRAVKARILETKKARSVVKQFRKKPSSGGGGGRRGGEQ